VECAVRGGAPLRGPARVLFGLGLDPNRADAASLEALPGVGPARAQAIVDERAQGAYRSLADLGRVPGIGPVTLRRAAPWLVFEAHPEAP
jgi:competence protein ComEA